MTGRDANETTQEAELVNTNVEYAALLKYSVLLSVWMISNLIAALWYENVYSENSVLLPVWMISNLIAALCRNPFGFTSASRLVVQTKQAAVFKHPLVLNFNSTKIRDLSLRFHGKVIRQCYTR